MRKTKFKYNLNKKNKIALTVGIVIFMLIIFIIEIIFNHPQKLNENFSLAKEKYKINVKENKIELDIVVENETKKIQHIDNIEIKILDNDNNEVFSYYRKVDKYVKEKGTYNLIVNESIDNSNINNKRDIKDIVYTIN